MADNDPLKGLAPSQPVPPGLYGRPGEPGVTACVRQDLAMVGMMARKGAGPALAEAVVAAFGIALPDGPRVAGDAALAFVCTGPGRWLAVSENRRDLYAELSAALGTHAALTEQGDASLVFDLAGANLRDVLAKGVTIDLHPSAFRQDAAATTIVAHIGVTLWRNGADGFRIAVARSYATAFTRFLVASAAEFGLRLEAD